MHRETGTNIQAQTHAKAETHIQTARKGFSYSGTSEKPWAAQYNTWLLSKLTPKGMVFSFLFFFYIRTGPQPFEVPVTVRQSP